MSLAACSFFMVFGYLAVCIDGNVQYMDACAFTKAYRGLCNVSRVIDGIRIS